MKSSYLFVITALLALASTLVHASDPDPLQDFCVGTNSSLFGVFVNGQFCKDPKIVTADDFSFSGLLTPGNTSNPLGTNVNLVNVDQFPGLNTIGVSIAHVDYAVEGLNPPHMHPRAAEILLCIEGTLLAGFVTSYPEYRLFSKVLNPGDAFLFPKGLIHFQYNVGETNALAIAVLTSQNPGRVTIANTVFGSTIPLDILEKAFQVDKKVIDALTKPFLGNNSPINLKSVTSFGTPPSGSWAKE